MKIKRRFVRINRRFILANRRFFKKSGDFSPKKHHFFKNQSTIWYKQKAKSQDITSATSLKKAQNSPAGPAPTTKIKERNRKT